MTSKVEDEKQSNQPKFMSNNTRIWIKFRYKVNLTLDVSCCANFGGGPVSNKHNFNINTNVFRIKVH